MKTNRWIDSSRKLFAILLNLYPREHRNDFAGSMQQVFTDQCHEAYRGKGFFGIFLLWLRVLPDLGYTAVQEHLSSPRAAWGLMEPVPNAPLPWKGVFMILLPGLVYLVSQIAQLTGEPWYMTVYYRAAFLLIIPVLVVWAVTRRFPIWGLIPVGLLFRLVKEIGYQLIVLHPNVFSSNPLLNVLLIAARKVQEQIIILVFVFLLAALILAVRFFWKRKPGREIWIWLGLFLLFSIAHLMYQFPRILQDLQNPVIQANIQANLSDYLNSFKEMAVWELYDLSAFLLLIFLGTLFTRRHGFFSILVMVGYILPAMVVGIPWDLQNNPNQVLFISAAVLAYRGILSLIAPIWMSRTASQDGKKRVLILSIALALVIHTVMQFYPAMFSEAQYPIGYEWFAYVVLDELRLASAILLGMVLYRSEEPLADKTAESYGVLPEQA